MSNMFKVNDKLLTFFIVNFQHISHFFLVFLLLTLNKYMLAKTAFPTKDRGLFRAQSNIPDGIFL